MQAELTTVETQIHEQCQLIEECVPSEVLSVTGENAFQQDVCIVCQGLSYLRNRIQQVSTSKSGLESSLNELRSENDELSSQVTTLQSQLNELESSKNELESSLSELRSEKDALETHVIDRENELTMAKKANIEATVCLCSLTDS